jgi:hypothetical protein
MIRRHRQSVLDVYKLLLGAFLFVSPWLFAFSGSVGAWSAWATGVLVVGFSAASIFAFYDWEEWLTFLLGVWLVLAPWVVHFDHSRATHISIGVGVIVLYLAALELWLVHYAQDGVGRDQTPEGSQRV